MNMKELSTRTDAQLAELEYALTVRGNLNAATRVHEVRTYYGKRVRVTKGRKVAHGTEGECFWMGSYDNSKYGDTWGIYTTVRIGIRDDNGDVHWTALDNVELV